MATETKPLSSAHRSRGQYRHIADGLLSRLNQKISLLVNTSETVVLAEVIGLESEIGSVSESVDRYGCAVSECLDLEEVPEIKIADDKQFQHHCTLLGDLSDIRSKLRTLRVNVETRVMNSNPLTSSSETRKPTTRINTALKPDELSVDASLADFKVWRTSYCDYYTSNHMDKFPIREQRAYLRGCLDVKTIQVMEQLLDVTESMEVNAVLEVLQKHFEESLSVMTRRVAFHRCTQKQGELFSDFFVRLKLLGSNAELEGMSYDDQLATRIVVAIQDKELQKDLLKIETPDLAKIKAKCLAWETAEANQQVLRDESGTTKIHKTIVGKSNVQRGRRGRDRSKSSISKTNEIRRCKCCGKKSHIEEDCLFKDKSCHECGKIGHLRPMCPVKKGVTISKSRGKSVAKTNAVRVCMAKNHVGRSTPLAKVTFRLASGLEIRFNVLPDTGATDSIVSASLMKSHKIFVDKARKCRILTANGTEMKCIGVVELNAKWGERESLVTAYVSPDTQDFILSWHDMVSLGMISETFPNPIPLCSESSKKCKALKLVQFELPPEDVHDPDANTVERWKKKIIENFADVFDSTSSFKSMKGPPMHIHLKDMGDCKPIHCTTAIPVPYAYEKEAKAEMENMESMEVIENAVEPSEWVSPFLVIPKPNGGVRFVVDFRRLNQHVKRPIHPFPSPSEITTSIPATAKWFATLDATKGYWQIPLDEESKKLTTFMTQWGRKRFTRAPMGLSSSGDEYCLRGDRALEGITCIKKVVDDILCYGDTFKELIETIQKVMIRCREHQITLAPHKFVIGTEVKFVGFIIGRDGVRADPSKIEAISNFPAPTNISELRSFFGMVNQFASFSSKIATVSEPLRSLLSTKVKFLWIDDHQKAFEQTKRELSSPPVLAHYDLRLPTKILTDASRLHGLGFALIQEHHEGWRLVQCGSRYLSDPESRYATCEIELLAVQWAIQECRKYLLGRDHFVVVTDHKPLLGIINGKNLDAFQNPRIQRLVEKLSPYNFSIEWVKGKNHCIPDALSRAPVGQPESDSDVDVREIIVSQLSVVTGGEGIESTEYVHRAISFLTNAARSDECYADLYQAVRTRRTLDQLRRNHPGHQYKKEWDRLSVDNSGLVLIDSTRIIVPFSARKEMLKRLHLAHQGIVRTKARARQTLFWHGMMNDIVQMINECDKCQVHRSSQAKEPMKSDIASEFPFQSVSTDLFEFGHRFFLVYVDRYTGWPQIDSYRNCPNTGQVIQSLRRFFSSHGIPLELRSDSGPQYRSQEFREFCSEFEIEHKVSSAHYPQSNGHAEACVKAMKDMVKKHWKTTGGLDQNAFDKAILEWRNTPREDGLSPAQWLYGRQLRTMIPVVPSSLKYLDNHHFVRAELNRAQQHQDQKEKYDENSKNLMPLMIGTKVRIQDSQTGLWDKTGEILKIRRNQRSYYVLSNGKEYLRNRRFLKPFQYLDDDDTINSDGGILDSTSNGKLESEIRRSNRVRNSPDRFCFVK